MIVNPILLIKDLLMQHTFQDITMTNKKKKKYNKILSINNYIRSIDNESTTSLEMHATMIQSQI